MVDPKTPEVETAGADVEPARDVLAAEAFAMPAPDPTLTDADAHDVLAAEEFAVPAPDPALHHPRVVLPEDLTGTDEAVDVLAAEEFAMPAGPAGGAFVTRTRASDAPWIRAVVAGLAALAAARLLARVLRRH